ncbi:MAG: hypothetical protein PVH88_15980 [Ignavibacteria bacterium]|jgi:hypothetical protein
MDKEEILKNILSNSNDTIVKSSILPLDKIESIEKHSLIEILGLDKAKFSEEAKVILDVLENDDTFPFRKNYQNFKWKLLSMVNIQDIFPGTIHRNYNDNIFLSRFYFYYESLHLLKEYFYCGFNNYLSAAQHLLRTIIEFNIKQCYYFIKCKNENSFLSLEKYLKDGVSPSNLKMINYYLPEDKFVRPIKKIIQVVLKNLSNTSSHAYKPVDSYRGNGKLQHEYSIDTLLFWLSLNNTIAIILWSYYIIFPMLFRPKNIIKKFGFNIPMGIFISDFQYNSIKYSLDGNELKLFEEYTKHSEDVQNYESFYNSQKTLSEEEIRATWDEEEELRTLENGYIMIIAKARAIHEITASKCSFDAQKNEKAIHESMIDKIDKFDWWRNNYSNI